MLLTGESDAVVNVPESSNVPVMGKKRRQPKLHRISRGRAKCALSLVKVLTSHWTILQAHTRMHQMVTMAETRKHSFCSPGVSKVLTSH